MLKEKFASGVARYNRDGVKGVLSLYPNRVYQWIKSHDSVWGRVVELKGNKIKIEGSTFNVDIPFLTCRQKANFMFDRYERPERIALREFLDPSAPVIEFGGNIGVVSCVVNRRLTNPENHIVVEANPELIPYLERNRKINNCRFQIVNALSRMEVMK